MHDSEVKAKIVAGVVATMFSWVANRFWTFRHRRQANVVRELVMFLIMNAIGLGIAAACVWITKYWIGLTDTTSLFIAGSVVGLVLGTIFRFFAYRFWVFGAELDEEEAFAHDRELIGIGAETGSAAKLAAPATAAGSADRERSSQVAFPCRGATPCRQAKRFPSFPPIGWKRREPFLHLRDKSVPAGSRLGALVQPVHHAFPGKQAVGDRDAFLDKHHRGAVGPQADERRQKAFKRPSGGGKRGSLRAGGDEQLAEALPAVTRRPARPRWCRWARRSRNLRRRAPRRHSRWNPPEARRRRTWPARGAGPPAPRRNRPH